MVFIGDRTMRTTASQRLQVTRPGRDWTPIYTPVSSREEQNQSPCVPFATVWHTPHTTAPATPDWAMPTPSKNQGGPQCPQPRDANGHRTSAQNSMQREHVHSRRSANSAAVARNAPGITQRERAPPRPHSLYTEGNSPPSPG